MSPTPFSEKRQETRKTIGINDNVFIEIPLPFVGEKSKLVQKVETLSQNGLSFKVSVQDGYFFPETPLRKVKVLNNNSQNMFDIAEIRHVTPLDSEVGCYRIGLQLGMKQKTNPAASVNFELTSEQKALQETVRKFVRTEIIPVSAYYDRTSEFPWDILRKAHDLGIFSCYIPEQYGGGGLGLLETALISEELGAGCTAMLTSIMVNLLATGPLLLAGTEEQKEKYLTPNCHKLTLFSFCFTEPDAGSDPSRIATTAKLIGDEYLINGSKCFITNAAVADYLVVFATIDKALKTGGITAFIIPSKTEGVKIGKTLDKMGQRASNTAEILFDNVRIPKINRIGEEGAGFKIGLQSLARSRVNVAAGAVGLARTAMELALKHVHTRVQFNKPLSNFQYVQFRLTDIARDIEAGRLLAWKAAFLHDRGYRFAKESSMAKDFCADLAMRASSEALDLFGGYGYSKELPMEKMMRDAKLLQIYEGPTPVHKTIVFRELAKEHGFEAIH